jgi:FixJ family two-component response regulator
MRGMGAPLRVAVVDDEEAVRRALGRMLTTSLFEVDSYASGREFLDSLLTRRPDCVLLDYHMPGLNAREVQQRLARDAVYIPVIVMTAHDLPALREQCLAEGALAFLVKPLRRDHLLSIIAGGVRPREIAI